jgi:hypothetical protein
VDWFSPASSTVSALAAVAGLIYAARTIEASRFSSKIDNLWRMMDKWESDGMLRLRAAAAQAMKTKANADEIPDVLGFFEVMGYLVRVQAVDAEATWSMFSDWALPYWVAAKYSIDEDRATDPTYWQEFEGLYKTLLEIEAQKRSRPERDVVPSEQGAQELLDSESKLAPGQPQPSRSWRRVRPKTP